MSPQPKPSAPAIGPATLDRIEVDACSDLDSQILMATLGCNLLDHKLMLAMFDMVLSIGVLDLNTAMANQDWQEVGEVAHHLKSSAQVIGALRLAVAMEQFEYAAKESHTGTMLTLHSDLPSMVSAFQASQVALH